MNRQNHQEELKMPNGPVWNEALLQADGVFPTVLAIGDSWFWYPKNNLAIPLHKILNRQRTHVMLVRGHNGAEAVEYQSGPVRAQIEWDLDRDRGYGRTLQAVFISGGGNDFAGKDDLPQLLLPDCSAANSAENCLRPGQPDLLFEVVRSALQSVYDLVQEKIPGTPVFVHGYDYACPNGQGFMGLGQWLQYPMDQCGVPRLLHQQVVNQLIDRFGATLRMAQRSAPHLHVVDGRETLTATDWANELHPTPAGFNRLAKCWRPVLENVGIA
jgi:hypothetical protein